MTLLELIIQTNQLDYDEKWNNLSNKILFKNFHDLDLIIQKILSDDCYANKLLNEIENNFLNVKKLTENSLDKIFNYK